MENAFKKFFRNVMLGTEYDDEEIYEEYVDEAPVESENELPREDVTRLDTIRSRKSKDFDKSSDEKSKIINFRSGAQMQVMITYPKKVDEATAICDYLCDGNICVINLEGVDRAIAQRIADFLGGAVYSVSGEIERINTNIFIIAPSTVRISGEEEDELKTSNILPWIASSFK
ncbi:MAG: cell division protein SepF [Clostridiales bacterium]|jgi:cell division inhibitor SepF|nr:cell division protein SepF [Clostridiales bacterium]